MSIEGAAASFASTAVSIGFAAMVFNQWLSRHKAYQLAWSLGLFLFAVAALMQGLAEAYGWSVAVYKIYYFVAAPLVAVLGVGSAFLAKRRLGQAFALYTLVLAAAFAWVVATAAVNTSAFNLPLPAGQGFDESVRIWSPLFTVPGSLALIGIALYSFWRTRFAFNLWIAAGGVAAASSGSLATFGVTWALYLGELIGIALLFWGFLQSREPAPSRAPGSENVPSS